MDRYSRENVLRIEDNDPNFTSLMIGGGVDADIDANFVKVAWHLYWDEYPYQRIGDRL